MKSLIHSILFASVWCLIFLYHLKLFHTWVTYNPIIVKAEPCHALSTQRSQAYNSNTVKGEPCHAPPKQKCQVTPSRKVCPITHFKDILLVVVFSVPYYNNIPVINKVYRRVFPKIYFCGPNRNVSQYPDVHNVETKRGFFGYVCLLRAMEESPGFRGYIHTNDDVIMNWWNLVPFNLDRIWQGDDDTKFLQPAYGNIHDGWLAWPRPTGQRSCQLVYEEIKNRTMTARTKKELLTYVGALSLYLENGKGKPRCGEGYSDFFYIPGMYAPMAADLFKICRSKDLFLEIAVTTVIRMLAKEEDIEKVHGLYLPNVGVHDSSNATAFWTHYSTSLTFIHPFKLNAGTSSQLNHAVNNILKSYGDLELKRLCR